MRSFIVKQFHTYNKHCGLKSSRVWPNMGLVPVMVNDKKMTIHILLWFPQ